MIALAGDPDVRIQERIGDTLHNLLSIEVKGGTDRSNAYNRGGEAEKSHQSARKAGFKECWTIIGMAAIDVAKLERGSPATDAWFETGEIVARQGDSWDDFRRRIQIILGL